MATFIPGESLETIVVSRHSFAPNAAFLSASSSVSVCAPRLSPAEEPLDVAATGLSTGAVERLIFAPSSNVDPAFDSTSQPTPPCSDVIGAQVQRNLATTTRSARTTALNDAGNADFSMSSDVAALVADHGAKVDAPAPSVLDASGAALVVDGAAGSGVGVESSDVTPSPADLKKLLNDSGVGLEQRSVVGKE